MTEERGLGITVGLLSCAAGVMDATAFLALGDVFTSAMSGNTIMLGVALGQGRLDAALHGLAAFLGYAGGAALAALPLRSAMYGIERAVYLETAFLAAFAGAWIGFGGPADAFATYALILLSAIAMGLQGTVGRALGVAGIPTIVITSTLTAIIGAIAERALSREHPGIRPATWHQLASFLAYLGGAIIAGALVFHWLGLLPLLPLAIIAVVVAGFGLRIVRPYK